MYVDERETGAYASQAMFRPSDRWKETDRKQAQLEDKACLKMLLHVWVCTWLNRTRYKLLNKALT